MREYRTRVEPENERYLSAEEESEVRAWSEVMGPGRMTEILEFLAERELELMHDPRIASDKTMRSISMQNVAALVGAIAALSPKPVVGGEEPELHRVDPVTG